MNLKVTKSHTGQKRAPLNNVGSRSRFNLAIISGPLSPDIGIKNGNSESPITFKLNKQKRITNVLTPYFFCKK